MEMKNKTGWHENSDGWLLFNKGRVLADFWLTEHSNPVKMMYSIQIMDEWCKEIELPSGNIDEAKEIIENKIISYTAEQISELQSIRYTVVKVAGERNNNKSFFPEGVKIPEMYSHEEIMKDRAKDNYNYQRLSSMIIR